MIETEIRTLVDDVPALQEKLRQRDFEEEPEYEQHDIILDKPDAALFRSGQKIRIRIEKGTATLTYKGHFQKGARVSHRKETKRQEIHRRRSNIAAHEPQETCQSSERK